MYNRFFSVLTTKVELSENLTIVPLQSFSCKKKAKFLFKRYLAGKSKDIEQEQRISIRVQTLVKICEK